MGSLNVYKYGLKQGGGSPLKKEKMRISCFEDLTGAIEASLGA
jgi:hypothetical protein